MSAITVERPTATRDFPEDRYADGLTQKAVHGVVWEGSSYLFGRILVFATTVVLARVLAPSDFGAVGLALVFIAAADVLTNVGLSQALIYLASDQRRADAALVLFVAVGAVMTVIGVLAAPIVSAFFHGPDITGLVRVCSLSLFVVATWQVPDALLRRNLRFRRRVGADVVRASARGAVSIALAVAGAGAWSIIIGSLIGDAVYGLVVWTLIDYRPSRSVLTVRRDDLRPLVRFGAPAAGAAFLSYVLFDIDYVIVARALGVKSLGYYLLAFRIPEMVIINAFVVFSSVAFPAFSRARGDRQRLARGYLSAVRLQSTFGIAAGVALALGSRPLIEIVFGAKWAPASVPLAFLGLYAAFRSIGSSANDAYKAAGHPDVAVKLAAVRVVILIGALTVATRWGIGGVAATQAVLAAAFAIGMQTVAMRMLAVEFRSFARALVAGFVISFGLAGGWVASTMLPSSPSVALSALAIGGVVGSALALLVDARLRAQARTILEALLPAVTRSNDATAGPLMRRALKELERDDVSYCIHHDTHLVDQPEPGADVDMLVAKRDGRRAHRALERAGFHRLFAPGHKGHRFYLGYEEGWLKVDVQCGLADGVPVGEVLARRVRTNGLWAAPPDVEAAHRHNRRTCGRGSPSTIARILRRCPGGPKRRGTIVALVGPDGAGKSTLAADLERVIPVATTTMYLGWGGRSPKRRPNREHREHEATEPSAVREVAFIVYRAMITWHRLIRVWSLAWRGHIVVCDRWPSEVCVSKPKRTKLGSFVERTLFVRLMPRPDHVAILNAPAALLYERKGEHTPAQLARWSEGYISVYTAMGGTVVDTDVPRDVEIATVSAIVWQSFCRTHGWKANRRTRGPVRAS